MMLRSHEKPWLQQQFEILLHWKSQLIISGILPMCRFLRQSPKSTFKQSKVFNKSLALTLKFSQKTKIIFKINYQREL
jgi:hypothetical protein